LRRDDRLGERGRHFAPLVGLLLLAACSGRQSALAPFAQDAQNVRQTTILLTVGGAIIFTAVTALLIAAVRTSPGRIGLAGGMRLILWGGAIVPTIVLGALLLYALPAMRPRQVAASDLHISVRGEQFWWRVRYHPPGGAALEEANELRLPVGRTVALDLTAQDVIHSFWVPGLAGKMDMIPGRTNRLVVRADRPGRYRGVCAEFCGLSHALMAFDVVAMPPGEFDAWLGRAARPASALGNEAFARQGCGGCHAVRGTGQAGTIGPDLTHFGARASVGAGALPMSREAVARFIRTPSAVKPGARMPAFDHIPQAEVDAIADYLLSLR
jgi:cytochrome c oxidase subunit II